MAFHAKASWGTRSCDIPPKVQQNVYSIDDEHSYWKVTIPTGKHPTFNHHFARANCTSNISRDGYLRIYVIVYMIYMYSFLFESFQQQALNSCQETSPLGAKGSRPGQTSRQRRKPPALIFPPPCSWECEPTQPFLVSWVMGLEVSLLGRAGSLAYATSTYKGQGLRQAVAQPM